MATNVAAEEAALREVAAYNRLEGLQGVHVPRLLAYGDTETHLGTGFYFATEFVEVLCNTLCKPCAQELRSCVQPPPGTSLAACTRST